MEVDHEVLETSKEWAWKDKKYLINCQNMNQKLPYHDFRAFLQHSLFQCLS
jgi:hypothetical protein